jgi:predicted transcriptional regulator
MRDRRKQLGWSQLELGDRAGVCQYIVSRMETGRRGVHLSTARKIIEALDCDVLLIPRHPATERTTP